MALTGSPLRIELRRIVFVEEGNYQYVVVALICVCGQKCEVALGEDRLKILSPRCPNCLGNGKPWVEAED